MSERAKVSADQAGEAAAETPTSEGGEARTPGGPAVSGASRLAATDVRGRAATLARLQAGGNAAVAAHLSAHGGAALLQRQPEGEDVEGDEEVPPELLNLDAAGYRRLPGPGAVPAPSGAPPAQPLDTGTGGGGGGTPPAAGGARPPIRTIQHDCADCNAAVAHISSGAYLGEASVQIAPAAGEIRVSGTRGAYTAEVDMSWPIDVATSSMEVTNFTWPSMTGADTAAVDAFRTALTAHEEGHFTEVERVLAAQPAKVRTTGRTQRAAVDALQTEARRVLAVAQTAINQATSDYDSRTNHGRTQSAAGGTDVHLQCPRRAPASGQAAGGAAGGAAVSRAVLARQPNASVPPPATPSASFAPPKITAIEHEGQLIATGVEGCREALERVAAAKGADEAHAWAMRFYNMETHQRAALETIHGKPLVDGTVTALRTADEQFVEGNKRFLMEFETRAGNIVDELLTKSEEQLKAERKRLELDRFAHGGGADRGQLDRVKAAAGELAAKRREADELGRKSAKAQGEWDEHTKQDPFNLDQGPKERADAARKVYLDKEKEYEELARRHTGEQPILAVYTTGGDAAQKLEGLVSLATGDPAMFAYKLKFELDKRQANVDEVRASLGDRFKPLKQPKVVSLTKQSLNAKPYQSRLVDDHIKKLEAEEEDSKFFWAALAIGLGLAAAIPTGGTSALAALAAAGAIGGAAVGAYLAYEEIREASLQSAAAGTALDKAAAISREEPDYFWLAIDVVTVVADVFAAAAAFKAVRAAMKAVSVKEIATLQKLADQCEAAKLSPFAKGRTFASAMAGAGGDLTVTLEQMMQVFKRIKAPPAEQKVVDYAAKMAEHMIAEQRVITVRTGHELDDIAAWFKLKDPSLSEREAVWWAQDLHNKLKRSTGGVYYPPQDVILLRMAGTPESVAGVFVHEITHQKQTTMKLLKKLTEFETEISAFASQRDFLKLVPREAISKEWLWLREAADGDIFLHVCKAYEIDPALAAKPSDTWMAMLEELRRGKGGAGAGPLAGAAPAPAPAGPAAPAPVQRRAKAHRRAIQRVSGMEDAADLERDIDAAFKLARELNAMTREQKLAKIQEGVSQRDMTVVGAGWASLRDEMVEVARANPDLFKQSLDVAGMLLADLPPFKRVADQFRSDVESLALSYLSMNRDFLGREMDTLGITDIQAGGEPSLEQQHELREQQKWAKLLGQAKEAMDRMRMIQVGYTEELVETGKTSWKRVVTPLYFDPNQKPGTTGIMGDRTYAGQGMRSWDEIKGQWDEVAKVRQVAEQRSPLLGYLGAEGDPNAFANADLAQARSQAATVFRTLIGRIEDASSKIGDDIEYEDLVPLHEQLFAGTPGASGVDWSSPADQALARRHLKRADSVRLLTSLGLGALSAALFIFAPYASIGIAAAMVGAGVGLGIGQAIVSWDRYRELRDARSAATDPRFQIISQETVDSALFTAIIDTAFAFIDVAGAPKLMRSVVAGKALLEAGEAGARQGAVLGLKQVGMIGTGESAAAIERAVLELGPHETVRLTGRSYGELAEMVGKNTETGQQLAKLAQAGPAAAQKSSAEALEKLDDLKNLAGKPAASEAVMAAIDSVGVVQTLRKGGGWKAVTGAAGEGSPAATRLESWRKSLLEDLKEYLERESKETTKAVRTGTERAVSDMDIQAVGGEAAFNAEKAKQFLAGRARIAPSELKDLLDTSVFVDPTRAHLHNVFRGLSDADRDAIDAASAGLQQRLRFSSRLHQAREAGDKALEKEIIDEAAGRGIKDLKPFKPFNEAQRTELAKKIDGLVKELETVTDPARKAEIVKDIGERQALINASDPEAYLGGGVRFWVTGRPEDVGKLKAIGVELLHGPTAAQRIVSALDEGHFFDHALAAARKPGQEVAKVADAIKDIGKHGSRAVEVITGGGVSGAQLAALGEQMKAMATAAKRADFIGLLKREGGFAAQLAKAEQLLAATRAEVRAGIAELDKAAKLAQVSAKDLDKMRFWTSFDLKFDAATNAIERALPAAIEGLQQKLRDLEQEEAMAPAFWEALTGEPLIGTGDASMSLESAETAFTKATTGVPQASVSRLARRNGDGGRVLARQPLAVVASAAPVAAGAAAPAKGPSSVDDPRFNPNSLANDLSRAIDQSDTTAAPKPQQEPLSPFRARLPEWEVYRKVNVDAVIRALDGLTASQVEKVDAIYRQLEGRPLRVDLFEGGGSKTPTKLTDEQKARIEALLKGTKAEPGDATPDARIEADAIELHGLLSGKLDEAKRERVMVLYRRPFAEIGRMERIYEGRYLRSPFDALNERLEGQQLNRVRHLRLGDTARADAAAIEDKRLQIEALNKEEQALRNQLTFDLGATVSASRYLREQQLKEKRQKLIADIEAIIGAVKAEALADEAQRNLGKSSAQAVRERLAPILAVGDPWGDNLGDLLQKTLGAPKWAAIEAMAEGSLVKAGAMQLAEMEASGTTSTKKLAPILRGFREQAQRDVLAKASDPDIPEEEKAPILANPRGAVDALAKRYVESFVQTYDELPAAGGKRKRVYDEIVKSADDENEDMLKALRSGGGELSTLDELDYAIRKRDGEGIKAALAKEPDTRRLMAEYDRRAAERGGQSLERVLFGRRGSEMGALLEQWMTGGMLSGRTAAAAREQLAKPAVLGGQDEVKWIVEHGLFERRVTEAHSGVIGWWRELGEDPETQQIMARSARQLKELEAQWNAVDPWGDNATEKRREILREMRRVRAALTGDATAYEEENARMLAELRSAVSFAVQIALAVALPGAGTLIGTMALQIGANVAMNAMIWGEEYGLDRLKADILGGVGGSLGGALAGKIAIRAAPGVANAAQRFGFRTALLREGIEMAGEMGGESLALWENQFTLSGIGEEGFFTLLGKFGGVIRGRGARPGASAGVAGPTPPGTEAAPPLPEAIPPAGAEAPGALPEGATSKPAGEGPTPGPAREGTVPEARRAPEAAARAGAEGPGRAPAAFERLEAGWMANSLERIAPHWPNMTVAQRCQALQKIANDVLAVRGVPNIVLVPENRGGPGNAVFRAKSWDIAIDTSHVGKQSQPTLGPGDIAVISDVLRHEVEHALQYWQMARYQASLDATPDQIGQSMGVDADVAQHAVDITAQDGRMSPRDMEAASLLWDVIYGGGSDIRSQRERDLDDLEAERRAAQRRIDAAGAKPNPADIAVRDAINAQIARLDPLYRTSVEEAEAFQIGDIHRAEAILQEANRQVEFADIAVQHANETLDEVSDQLLRYTVAEPPRQPPADLQADFDAALDRLKRLENKRDDAAMRRDAVAHAIATGTARGLELPPAIVRADQSPATPAAPVTTPGAEAPQVAPGGDTGPGSARARPRPPSAQAPRGVAPPGWPTQNIRPIRVWGLGWMGIPDTLPPGVVYVFPGGEKVWRSPDGTIAIESTLKPGPGRGGHEGRIPSRGEYEDPGYMQALYERAHSQGQGTGFEAPYGIRLAPSEVNQRLQRWGIEELLYQARDAHPDAEFHIITDTETVQNSLRLAEITYRIDVTVQGERKRLFELGIIVEGTIAEPRIELIDALVWDKRLLEWLDVDLSDVHDRFAAIDIAQNRARRPGRGR